MLIGPMRRLKSSSAIFCPRITRKLWKSSKSGEKVVILLKGFRSAGILTAVARTCRPRTRRKDDSHRDPSPNEDIRSAIVPRVPPA